MKRSIRSTTAVAGFAALATALSAAGCDDDETTTGPVGTGAAGGAAGAGGTDPCAGVSCDEAPPPVCVAEDRLRTYTGPGRCIDGSCVYDEYTEAACTDCCYGAEINLTGNPLGGGEGYSDIIDPAEATVVVATPTQLLDALADAAAGDIIYIEDDATIDLTGEESIDIPSDITLASGRGRDGSRGGLIVCDSYANPLFSVVGDSVRVTGLRMRGPQPDLLDHDYDLVVHSGAIWSGYPSLEVDNCELWAWGTTAVSLGQGALEAHVHHNYIHHTRRAGLGYGVVLNRAEALIEGNIFDTCRHHIAATGRPGTSYEAAYNLVLEHASSHGFDMHGARDFDKYDTKAIWRFDEGQDDIAYDTSIGYYHHLNHCTLTAMDTASCWVPGRINTALDFDGLDDHLECGNDASLTSETGTIYFWLQPATLGQDADIVRLFEDASANYLVIRLTAQNRIFVGIEDDDVAHVALTSDVAIAGTDFHHVAVTQDSTGVVIYLDGQPISATGSDSDYWTDHLTLAGAWLGGGPAGYYEGVLDEVRVYSRALEPEEVALHHGGNPDIAGDWMRIHHNTFRDVEQSAIVVRGKPAEGADIHHNWFHLSDPDRAARQVNAEGNFDVHDNHYGKDVPLGTVLPQARATVEPAFGKVPLEVWADGSASFDPVGRILATHWDWGDGQTDAATALDHSYAAPGRYVTRTTVFDEAGVRESAFLPVTVSPSSGTYQLDFWVKDSYVGPLTDFYRKQALVDGALVWEDDVAGDEGWEHVRVDVASIVTGKDRVEVELRVQNINAVELRELIELDVFWDDVVLFGGVLGGGDFEQSGAWSYAENGDSWSGRVTSREPHSGNWAYMINYPYVAVCPAGAWAHITQSVPITPLELRGSWRLDEGQGLSTRDESVYGNHGRLTNMDAAESWTQGVMGAALAFDGQDDLVDFGAATSLASARGSITLWARFGAGGSEQVLFELFDDSHDDTLSLARTADGRLRVVNLRQGATVVDVQSNVAVTDADFHHVAATQDGSAVRLYLDGADAGATGSNGPAWTDHIPVAGAWLGRGRDSAFVGTLDEVSVTEEVLDAAAVAAAYRRAFPLAVWSFDEGQGTTAADSSSYGHHGTLTDMDPATCWVAGRVDGALSFDGADDYVDCAEPATLASAEGTIEFWLKLDGFDATHDIVNIFEDGYENYLLVRHADNNRLYVRIEDDDAELLQVSSTVTLTDDDYHHVAITQDGSGVLIYIDGEEAGTAGNNGGAWTSHLALTGMWLGGGHWSNFSGVLDEVRLYPRALRPSEIAARAAIP